MTTKIVSTAMKYKPLIIVCLLLISEIATAQKIDSVRQIIRAMGNDLPRLSPVPESINEIKTTVLSLNGTWKFSPDSRSDSSPQNIEVPGEWAMQGFNVKPGTFAEYKRNFNIPSGWKDKRIKIRCDAVFSECEVFINGRKAGGHLGGFTAFETDITDFVRINKDNLLSIKVRSESIADSLSSASQYAVHPLGGISRKIYLMALPELNCSMFHVSTVFDADYQNARLNAEVELANESAKGLKSELRFELRRADNSAIIFKKDVKIDEILKANSITLKNYSFDVEHPMKWDPEHPNLYTLKLTLVSGGKVVEVIKRVFGFKQTEVRGNQVFVNNMPIKLRGVCRHEVMPLRGRSLTPGQWEEDVKIFRAANVNYIRTSHYPPAPELIEACDSLGMFVEVEGPFCWAERTSVPEKFRYQALIQPELEMVNTFRSNPSVLMWSIANESGNYKEYFSQSAALVKAVDPTRPRNYSSNRPADDNEELEIGNHHYPGPTGPEKYTDSKRPVTFDEYCHLNAYNRYELMTDPGVRDFWGDILFRMWEGMYHSKGVLGGALWAGIDDSFFLPNGSVVGYGTWGPIDGWRRPKPEYWHMKKIYSPVKVKLTEGQPNDSVTLELENRYLFSNLNECRMVWKNGDQSGEIHPDIKSGSIGLAKLPLFYSSLQKLSLDIFRDSEIPVDQYVFDQSKPLIKELNTIAESFKWSTNGPVHHAESSKLRVSISSENLIISDHYGKEILNGWPVLMLIPFNSTGDTQMTKDTPEYGLFSPTASNRKIDAIEVQKGTSSATIVVKENYKEAVGKITVDLFADGRISLNYEYKMLTDANLRQWGISFKLPETMNTLSWKRKGLWSVYPENHIGRNEGLAKLFYDHAFSGLAGPSVKPGWSYNMDQTKFGSNDFRSTKRNILWSDLQSESGTGIKVISDGLQHFRCWIMNRNVFMLVSEYDNPGSERFLRNFADHAAKFDQPLKQSQTITGRINLQILSSKN